MAGAGETSYFGASKSTFRDRCKGSELFYFEVQFSWQVQHVEEVTGAVNRDFWTCGSFADFVAGTALCDPRCADFVTGAALCEPRSADFVDLVNLEVQISWQAQHFVDLEVHISWHSTW